MGLTINDRKVIAKRWADGDSTVAIAESLGRSPGTIYAELTRDHTGELDLNSRPKYDPEREQAVYQANLFPAHIIPQGRERDKRQQDEGRNAGQMENEQMVIRRLRAVAALTRRPTHSGPSLPRSAARTPAPSAP